MKKLHFQSATTLKFSVPVTNHYFLLRNIPPSFSGQRILSATLTLTPDVPYTLYTDGLGNLNETGCIPFPHEEFIYSISGVGEINNDERKKETLQPIYKFPSFYTCLNNEMMEFVKMLNLKGSMLENALQLADTIFNYMTYQSGVTSTSTTAIQAFTSRQGVCQDYAHLFIALARHIGIPARYANGLPLGAGPTHAWAEIYVDGIWIGIDPTHNRLVGEDYIRFGIGRDFKDCALERGILTGGAYQMQKTMAQVIEQ